MDKLQALGHYSRVYRAEALQLGTLVHARLWLESMPGWRDASPAELEAHAAQSARWASLGYTPAEAAPLIADGATPDTVAEMDRLRAEFADSPEAEEMARLDEITAAETFIDPSRVVRTVDPDDPTHIIVTIYES